MLAFSAAYNMWPVSPVKWVLRRFDHSAIYLLIAATYTPFLGQMKNTLASAGLGIGVWLSAAAGVTHSMPAARLERYRCLRLPRICHPQPEPMASCRRGYSLLVRHALSSLGALALSQRAWHGFVLLAASCHYSAVLACLPGHKRPFATRPKAYVKKLSADAMRRREFIAARCGRAPKRLHCLVCLGVWGD
jgi:hemolysin III